LSAAKLLASKKVDNLTQHNIVTKFELELLQIHLINKLSIEEDPIGTIVIKHFLEEIQSGPSTIIEDIKPTAMEDVVEEIYNSGKHSKILSEIKSENNFLRRELHRLKNSKPKPKTYKYMVRNSLGNANFNINQLASYLNNCPTSNLIIDEYLNRATQQLIDLIHILGVNNEKKQ